MTKHINELRLSNVQVAKKDATTLTNGQTLFTISGGPILVHRIIGYCITGNGATASTFQASADPVVGVGSTTGTWEWYIQYEPLAPNVTVA